MVKETEKKDAGTTAVGTKTAELADVDEKNARSKEDRDATSDILESDQKFLQDLKERCATVDPEYEQRTKTRQTEIMAVSKALAFLSSDEASDLFSRTFSPQMLQVSSSRQDAAAKAP